MTIEGERFYRKLPEVSKSSIKTFKYFCSYLFWNATVLGEEQGDESIRCNVGTDTHLIFSEFWSKRGIDHDYIYTLKIDPALEFENNPLTHYFYGVCMTLTPKYDRDVPVLQRIFWKFACLHSARFLYLYSLFNGNKIKVWEYFYPKEIEQFFVSKKYGIYGTLDTAFKDVDEQLNETMFLPDYKTGNIPKDVLRGPKNVSDETSVKLPTKFMFECHFYGLLYLLHHNWAFHGVLVHEFVMNDKYATHTGELKEFGLGKTKEKQAEIDKKKRKYLTRIDTKLKRYNYKYERFDELEHGDLTLGIIFLSGDPDIHSPVVVRKKFNYKSLNTVLHRINEIKSVYKNRDNLEYYLVKKMRTRPEYNKYKCGPHCSRNQKCLEEIERDFKRGL